MSTTAASNIITLTGIGLLIDKLSKMCYNNDILEKGNDMTTVKDLIARLQEMPQDSPVILCGSYETYDGFSHPRVTLDTSRIAQGEVIISEACEDEVTQ